MRFQRYVLSLLLLPSVLFLNGCYPLAAAKVELRISAVQEMACAMYDEREQDLGPPSARRAEEVRDFGRSSFVGFLAAPKISHHHCRDLHKYVYALGWFGDLWHVDLIAGWLGHDNPKVKRSALAAFSRLTAQRFDNAEGALAWWSQHQNDFPRFKREDQHGGKSRG